MTDKHWSPGDRFAYIMMKGGFGYGTVLRVDGDKVIAKLDCQKDGEEYRFHRLSPYFLKED